MLELLTLCLIDLTGNDSFPVREAATAALAVLNNEFDLRQTLKNNFSHTDPEVHWRLREVVDAYYHVEARQGYFPRLEFMETAGYSRDYGQARSTYAAPYHGYSINVTEPKEVYKDDSARRRASQKFAVALLEKGLTRQRVIRLLTEGVRHELACGRVPVPRPEGEE